MCCDHNPDMFQDIRDFHNRFGLIYDGPPRMLDKKMSDFRSMFMAEELAEYIEAKTLEKKLDALVDLVYVAMGTAYLHGCNFDEAWRRVQEANMKKRRATSEEQSKRNSTLDVVKPEGWTPPDLSDLCVGGSDAPS